MAGLYYCANTHLPDGFSDAFVDSLKPLQWGLGTLFFLGRCGLEQREQEEELQPHFAADNFNCRFTSRSSNDPPMECS